MTKLPKARIKTYIKGLDDQMNGGLPEGHVVLLSGTPGTMKSSVAYSILFYNAKENKIPGLYISLEQSRESLIDHMKGLGMDHEEVKNELSIVDIGYLRKNLAEAGDTQNIIDLFKMYAENLKENMQYKILVADSLPVLEILSMDEPKRSDMFQFFEWLRDLEVTTLFITEAADESTGKVRQEDFLADGVIRLKKERIGTTETQRFLLVDKMRGTNHATCYFTLLFEKNVFQITKSLSDLG